MTERSSRVMPHNIEAEEAILGCVLLDSEIASDVLPELSVEDFYSETNKTLFESMSSIYNLTKPIDFVTMTDELENKLVLGKVGGIDTLTRIANVVPSAANFKHYLDIVKRDSLRRKLIRSSQEIIEKSFVTEDKVDALSFAEKSIFDISSANERSGPSFIGDSFNDIVDKFNLIGKDKNAFRGVTTGFKGLNDILNGLHRSDLVLIAARPAEGKTSFAMNIVENACVMGKATAICFSLEMSKSQLAQRMLCSNARVSMSKALKGELTLKDWDALWEAKKRLSAAKILIDDTAGITPAEMLSKCRKMKNKYGLDLVMVDYLQLMSSGGANNESRQNEISAISRQLKLIAKEIDVPVIALSQLSRSVESRTPPIPQLSDLRDSGAIEQDADIVMFIYNPAKVAQNAATPSANFTGAGNSGVREIIIAKHRNGSTGKIPLRWIGEYVRFEDAENFKMAVEEQERKVSEPYAEAPSMGADAELFMDIVEEDLGGLMPPPEEEF